MPVAVNKRSEGIGASEAWMLFDDPMTLYLRKAGLIDDPEETEAMWLGKEFEAILDRRYFKETGLAPEPVAPIIHPDEPWRRCSPDRVVKQNGNLILLEYKTTGFKDDWGEPGTDQVPFRVGCQVQWQLSLMPEIQEAQVPVYFFSPRRAFHIFHLERNQDIIDNLVDAGRNFWENHVIPRIPPPLDASEGTKTLLKALYPQDKGEIVPAPPSAAEWLSRLQAAKEVMAETEKDKALAEAHVKSFIGDNRGILSPEWRATWTLNKPTVKVDWEAVAQIFKVLQPQTFERAVKESTTTKPGPRVLRITKVKEAK